MSLIRRIRCFHNGFGEAEVDYLYDEGVGAARIVSNDHQVARFQVAMH